MTDLIRMVPYVVTIVVLIVVSQRRKKENQPPATDLNGLRSSTWVIWQLIDNHISKEGYNGKKDKI